MQQGSKKPGNIMQNAATKYSREYAKSYKEIGNRVCKKCQNLVYKVCKKGSKELGEELWKKRQQQTRQNVCKGFARNQAVEYARKLECRKLEKDIKDVCKKNSKEPGKRAWKKSSKVLGERVWRKLSKELCTKHVRKESNMKQHLTRQKYTRQVGKNHARKHAPEVASSRQECMHENYK